MPLTLEFGYTTATGPRERNEDYGGFVEPADPQLAATKGMLAVVADGVSGGTHGREAAESSVRNLLTDYYATPDTWEIPHALGTVLTAINRWIHGQTASRTDPGGMATTLTALVLRGRRYHYAHVGDSRLYRMRGETLSSASGRKSASAYSVKPIPHSAPNAVKSSSRSHITRVMASRRIWSSRVSLRPRSTANPVAATRS